MSQKTLDRWLNIKKSKRVDVIKIKKYFYLDWSSGFLPLNGVWLDKKPDKINFQKELSWDKLKKGFKYTLCGYFPNINEKFILTKEKKYWNGPYLKSHLQKCIRQMETLKALKTASHFIHLDLVGFMRRLPIIMLEDVYLNKCFSTIIWLMVAFSSTDFTIKKYILEYLLGVIYLLCNIDKHDKLLNNDNFIINDLNFIKKYNRLKEDKCSVLYSLTMRKHYGGMNGDMDMIDKYIYKWYNKFNMLSEEDKIYNFNIKPINDNMEELLLKEWNLNAIDFHCSNIIDYLVKKYDFFSIEELKKIIWYSLSCKNKRLNQKNPYEREFNKIKEYIVHVQKFLLLSKY